MKLKAAQLANSYFKLLTTRATGVRLFFSERRTTHKCVYLVTLV